MESFEGRVAVVTGAGRGIGRALCVAFAREGASVVAADIEEAAMQETVARVTAAGSLGIGRRGRRIGVAVLCPGWAGVAGGGPVSGG